MAIAMHYSYVKMAGDLPHSNGSAAEAQVGSTMSNSASAADLQMFLKGCATVDSSEVNETAEQLRKELSLFKMLHYAMGSSEQARASGSTSTYPTHSIFAQPASVDNMVFPNDEGFLPPFERLSHPSSPFTNPSFPPNFSRPEHSRAQKMDNASESSLSPFPDIIVPAELGDTTSFIPVTAYNINCADQAFEEADTSGFVCPAPSNTVYEPQLIPVDSSLASGSMDSEDLDVIPSVSTLDPPRATSHSFPTDTLTFSEELARLLPDLM